MRLRRDGDGVLAVELRLRRRFPELPVRVPSPEGSRTAEVPKVIDMLAVLGVKVFCQDVPATDLVDQSLTVEAEFAPGAWSGEHVHPNQEESFEGLSGVLDVLTDGRWKRLQPGESVRIPKGTV